jgi:hypothetical protein
VVAADGEFYDDSVSSFVFLQELKMTKPTYKYVLLMKCQLTGVVPSRLICHPLTMTMY